MERKKKKATNAEASGSTDTASAADVPAEMNSKAGTKDLDQPQERLEREADTMIKRFEAEGNIDLIMQMKTENAGGADR